MARDTNFYYSFLVLPPEKRQAIVAVWDFCRAVDDAVDEVAEESKAMCEIARWRTELAAVFDGGTPATPQGRALAPFVGQFSLPRSAFEALIEGVEMDLGSRRYETFGELYEYCIRVASAVGLICLNIFGARDPGARQYAIDLGVALQLTNILRDIPGDMAQGRLYVPLEDLRAHGCQLLTIGQYLRPSKMHLPVVEYVHPDRFAAWRDEALAMGFESVASGPLVRSSYHADLLAGTVKPGEASKAG